MIRRPPRSTQGVSSAASDVYKRQSLRSFIGMCKYLRRYLKDCAKHCMKLNELLCSDSDGKWTEEHARAWDALKHDVAITKGVWHPNYHHPIYVCTDGSKHGIGGYVYQLIGGEERHYNTREKPTTNGPRDCYMKGTAEQGPRSSFTRHRAPGVCSPFKSRDPKASGPASA